MGILRHDLVDGGPRPNIACLLGALTFPQMFRFMTGQFHLSWCLTHRLHVIVTMPFIQSSSYLGA